MTVFKTFWKIVKSNKSPVITYTVILIVFGFLSMQAPTNQTGFVNTKPDVLIVNNNKGDELSDNLVNYFQKNSNLVKIKNDENSIDDALFYRNVNYVIYLPNKYSELVRSGEKLEINIKSTGDYNASLADLMLKKYLKVQNIYAKNIIDDDMLIKAINRNMSTASKVSVKSQVDTIATSNASTYYSFASYSIMAVVIFIICLVMCSFHSDGVYKRTLMGSMNYKKYNRELLFASLFYGLIVWVLFNLFGVILIKDLMFTTRGVVYLLNSLVFTFCSLTLALLISTLVRSKDAVNGIVNVVALGSSFLCGAFVPAKFLPKFVLSIAHFLPSFWYINSNNLLIEMENVNISNLNAIFSNMLVLVGFSVLFIILNNIISKFRQRI